MFYNCKNKSQELGMCGWEYFHVCICIIASASPANWRTLQDL